MESDDTKQLITLCLTTVFIIGIFGACAVRCVDKKTEALKECLKMHNPLECEKSVKVLRD